MERRVDAVASPPRIFVSHSSLDNDFGTRLVGDLRRVLGDEQAVWYDSQGGLQGGDGWWSKIISEISTRNVFIVILSVEAVASPWVETEINIAWHQKHDKTSRGKLILPVLYRPCHIRDDLRTLQMISFVSPKRYEAAFAELLLVLQTQNVSSSTVTPDTLPHQSYRENELTLPVWNIPYRRNPFFTGRDGLLSQLRDVLSKNTPTALTQAQAISGLGGIGKTQSAVEYAYRYREMYRYVLWMRAASRDVLLSEFVTLARLLQLPEQHEQDPHQVVTAVQDWLGTHKEWLLILDNADDLAMVDPFLPRADTGHILLTTRAQAGGSIAHIIEVEKMGLQEGVLLLLRRAKLIGSDGTSEQAALKHRATAEAIVRELDGLPLALDQAGAYIEETQCILASYLERYRKRHLDLLRRRGNLSSDHPESVGATWSLSFQLVKQANPSAADLLRLCAFLDPDAIPEELFQQGAAELGPLLKPVAADSYFLDEAIAELRKYSLIRRNAEKREISIHRLVQAVLKEEMTKKAQCQWAERAVRAVACAFPNVDVETIQQCQRFYPQSSICAVLINQYVFTFTEAVDLLNRTAFFLQEQAFYAEAEPLYKQALTIREKTLGSEHPHTATSHHSLACLYHVQGKYEMAEPLYQRAIAITRLQLGNGYSSTDASLNNLALLYLDQGKHEEAESLFKRALTIRQHQLGQEHPDIAYLLNNLATLYHERRMYEEAEPLYQRALAIREKGLGSEHPHTATSLHNLAYLYCDLRRYEETELLCLRALAIREKVLGPEHPDTAMSLGSLSILYHKQEKYEEAEPLIQRTLAIREKVLGSEHPHIATTLNIWASHYHDQGRYEEAERLIQRALAIREKAFGSDHPRTVNLLKDYIALLRAMKREEEAATLEARIVATRVGDMLASRSTLRGIEFKDILNVYADGIMQFYY